MHIALFKGHSGLALPLGLAYFPHISKCSIDDASVSGLVFTVNSFS